MSSIRKYDSIKIPNQTGGAVPYVLLVLAVVVVGLGAWFWQQRSATTFNNRINSLQKELDEAKKADTTSADEPQRDGPESVTTGTDIITGQVRQGTAAEGYVVECMMLPGKFDEYWVEYGDTSSNLSKETEHSTEVLTSGERDSYGVLTRTLTPADIKPGTMYFYRCVGEKDNREVQAGVVSFTTRR